MSLTTNLKNDHRVLLEAAGDLARMIPSAPAPALASKLKSIKDSIVSHLSKEDNELYPTVKKLAEKANDHMTLQSVNTFQSSMTLIASTVMKFFTKYGSNESLAAIDRQKFLSEWDGIAAALQRRINSEENGLYRMYDRLAG